MRKAAPLLLSATVAAGTAAMLLPRDAFALGPLDLEAAAKVGVASNPADVPSGVSASNPLGIGVGARAGVAITGWYIGGNLMYYLGASDTIAGVDVSEHTTMYGLEGGYGLTLLDLLTIRPQVGVGNATLSSSPGASKSNLYIEPGATGMVSLGLVFVGADANLLFFPGLDNTKMAVTIHGQLGVKL